jgi:hypothetical protein
MAKFTNCLQIVNAMPEQDQDALLARLDELQARGMSPKEAQLQAAIDVLAQVEREGQARKSPPRLSEDIPNESWLQGKIDYAERKGRNQWGVPHMSTVTGYFDKPVEVSLRVLSRLKGERDEQNNVREESLDYIRKNWDEVSQQPPYIEVAYNGEAWVSEGNHRIMVAAEKGLESLPVEIRYFDGGQRRNGPLSPSRIPSLEDTGIRKSEERRSVSHSQVMNLDVSRAFDAQVGRKKGWATGSRTVSGILKSMAKSGEIQAARSYGAITGGAPDYLMTDGQIEEVRRRAIAKAGVDTEPDTRKSADRYVTAKEISEMERQAFVRLQGDGKYKALTEKIAEAEEAGSKRFNQVVDKAVEILKSRPGFKKISDEYDAKTVRNLARVFMDEADGLVPEATPSLRDATQARQDYVEQYLKDAGIPEPREFSDRANQDRGYYDSLAFRRWFKSSKAVDANGRPLVAFHVTTKDFVEFDTNAGKTNGQKSTAAYSGQLGSWFTAPSLYSDNYEPGNAEAAVEGFIEDNDGNAKPGAVTMPVHLSIQNPMEYSDFESMLEDRDSYPSIAKFKADLVSQGHDGIIIRNSDTDGAVDRDDWVAFEPTQIKSAIGNSGTFDPANPDIRKSPERDANFKRWSGGAPVIELGDNHEFRSGEPVVVEALHGTTNADLTEFKRSRANIESDWGAGFYASNTPEDVATNYANNDGADLTQRIELMAELLAVNEFDDDMDAAREEAKRRLTQESPNTLKLYVRISNPAVQGGKGETFFDYTEEYDEEADSYAEPTGLLVDFVESLRNVADDFDDVDADGAMEKVWGLVSENDGIGLSDLREALLSTDSMAYAADTGGNSAANEVLRRALRGMGFDGVIDTTVATKFKNMKGMNKNTVHFIAFNPEQIKSATGNSGEFGENRNIIKSVDRPQFYSQLQRAIEGVPDRLSNMGAMGWKQWIDSNGPKLGVKKEEIEWSGIKDYLDLQGKKKLSKDDLSAYLDDSGVKVSEVELGGDLSGKMKPFTTAQNPGGLGYVVLDNNQPNFPNGRIADGPFDEEWEADRRTKRLNEDLEEGEYSGWSTTPETNLTKYSKYTLPGGTSYRELLITLPESIANANVLATGTNKTSGKPFVSFEFNGDRYVVERNQDETDQQAINRRINAMPERGKISGANTYQSTHWDQKNVLAHIRINDRVVQASGFVVLNTKSGNRSEVFATREQAEAYQAKLPASVKTEITEEPRDVRVLFVEEVQSDWSADGRKKGFASKAVSATKSGGVKTIPGNGLRDRYEQQWLITMQDGSVQERVLPDGVDPMRGAGNKEGPPLAPFVQKTDGWLNLALKRIAMVAVEGGYDKVAFVNGEQSADRYDLSKQIQSIAYSPEEKLLDAWDKDRRKVMRREITDESQLEDYIGKEVAQRLLATKPVMGKHLLDGEDIKVGGEGMKTFYDQIVPQALNKLLPKIGGERVKQLPVSRDAPYTVSDMGDGYAVVNFNGNAVTQQIPLEQASLMAKERNRSEGQAGNQPGFDVTPKMRETVSQGLPLFSRDRVTSTPEFKKWFGDSKVVDDAGNPLVMYTGTSKDVDFKSFKIPKNGAWFTTSPEEASMYAKENDSRDLKYEGGRYVEVNTASRVLPVYLRIENPATLSDEDMQSMRMASNYKKVQGQIFDKLRAQGYDGVDLGGGVFVAIKDPAQIKSAIGNDGGFDATNPDIRKSADRTEWSEPKVDDVQRKDSLSKTSEWSQNTYGGADKLLYGEAFDGSNLIGRAMFGVHRDLGLLEADKVWVDQAYRRKGVATQLINEAKARTGLSEVWAPHTTNDGDSLMGSIHKSADRPWFEDLSKLKVSTNYQLGDLLKSNKKLNWWNRTVGTQYNLAQRNPEFKRVFDAVQTFINNVSAYATQAADLAPSILPKLDGIRDVLKKPLALEDVKALRDPVFGGTLSYMRDGQGNLIETDDVQKAGVVFTDTELREKFNLNDRQIGLYREFRQATDRSLTDLALSDMVRYLGEDGADIRTEIMATSNVTVAAGVIESHLEALAQSKPARRESLQATIDAIKQKADQANNLMDRGYAPLSRFGQYTVYAAGKGGEQLYFGMFETQRDANKMVREMQEQYPDAEVTAGVMSQESYKLFSGVTPETLALFGESLGLEESGIDPKSEAFQAYLKLAKTNRSAMKRLIQRKGIDGFSEDAGRVLAGFVYSNARQISTNLNAGEIGKAASDVKDGDVKDHAIRLMQYIQNPTEEAQKLKGLLFTVFLGGNISSAAVNLSQTATTTFPYLAQFDSTGKVMKRLGEATKLAVSGIRNDEELKQALKRAEDEGIVSPQEVFALMAQAQGKAQLQSGDGTVTGDALAKTNNFMTKAGLAWGRLFSAAEQANRRIAFIAAYKLARDKNIENPFAFAEKAVLETQFSTNKGIRPVWARGAVGGVLFTFKGFTVSYLELLSRMLSNGPEGKKAFALALGTLFLLAGAGGLPFVDDLDDAIDAFAQRVLNKSFNSAQAKKEFFASIFGQAGAEFVMSGISSLPGAPIDVSGRLGLGNIVPGTGIFPKKSNYQRDVMEVLGPAGSLFTSYATAIGLLAQGEVTKAATTAAPLGIQNMIKGLDMATMGFYRDTRGRKVIDTNGWEALAKSMGFQPASVKQIQEATFTQQILISQNKIRETEIADKMARARIERKPELAQDAREELAEWNRKNPQSPINIDASQINRRVQQAMMEKAKRLEKTAPKEIRQSVRQELERASN